MSEVSFKPNSSTPPAEGIDFNKLRIILRKNLFWVLLIFVLCNLAAYLTIRYTKDLFESESELKLDIKQNATELGIKNFVEEQNLNVISGEIEQIRSRLFFNQVIDSMNLSVNYYYLGNVLNNELYKISPFEVDYQATTSTYFDQPFYFNFVDNNSYTVQFGEKGIRQKGTFAAPLILPGIRIIVKPTLLFLSPDGTDYSFVLNSRKKLLDYLTNNITVEPLNFNANTIRISFRDNNALKAFDITSHIDSLYIKYSYQQKNLANKQKIEWLNNELAQVEKKMGDFENYFETFTLQNRSSDLSEDLKKTILQINKIDSQRFELNKRISSLNTLIDELNTGNYQSSFSHQQFLPAYMNAKLEALEKMIQDQDKLGLSYNENTFAFKQKEQQLNKLKTSVFTSLADLKTVWMRTSGELTVSKQTLEREFSAMPDKNTQFSKKQRFYKLNEEIYLSMMQSKSEFEISQAGSTPDFKILSSASLPSVPISPKKYVVQGIGLVAGIVLSLLFVGILYLVNNKITSAQEIESTIAAPVLGTIPLSNHSKITPFHVVDNPKSSVSESIRSLRTNLDFFTTSGLKKVISVSSTISGEGKSFLAMNLGGVIAMSHKKVILLDLDMRKSKTNLQLEIADMDRGISTILIKKHTWQDSLIHTSLASFDYIPSGPHPPNPSELLLNGEFSSLLEELRQVYDFIIIDTPPVGLVTDGIMAMRRSDLSIYVFRANYSKKEFLYNLQRTININKLKNVATVLNAVPPINKGYGFGYYEDVTLPKRGFKKLFKA
jgi:tyrosine-protein kinase Etk/Wzc